MDTFCPKERRRVMQRVRSKNTRPEMMVRSMAHSLGYRYRLHHAELEGKPDLVFVKRRKVIFVHGCFWHGHSCPRGARIPKTNREYWIQKIARNRKRDQRTARKLRSKGWGVMTIWECDIGPAKADVLERRIIRFLDS